MNISTAFENIQNLNQLDGLLSSETKGEVSFWGFRKVKVEGYRGSIHPDKILVFFLRIKKKQRDNKKKLQLPNTLNGRIDKILKEIDVSFNSRNAFSRMLCKIWDFFNEFIRYSQNEFYGGPRFQWYN